MNQILDTGDEKFQNNNIKYEVYNSKTKKQPNHEKSVIEINKIVIFFAISILILGICISNLFFIPSLTLEYATPYSVNDI